MLMFELVC